MSKKYLSIFLVICILLTGYGNTKAFASNEDSEEMQYVMEVLNGYLQVNDELVYDELSISTQRHIYKLDGSESGKNYYLLLSTDAVIGMIVVEKVNDSYFSHFTTEAVDTLSDLYEEMEAFALSSTDGNLLLVTAQGYEIIVSSYLEEVTNVDTSHLEDKLAIVTVADVSQSPAMRSLNSSTYTVAGSPPPFVGNINNPANGVAVCWAASIASVINYRRGNTSETALSVFMDCWNTVSYSQDDIPFGSSEWMTTAFLINGINDITYIEDSLGIGQISSLLGTDSRPIIAVIYSANNEDVIYAHAVVIYEFSINGSNGYYKVMDPNYGSYITIAINYDSLNNTSYFPYTPVYDSTIRYTRWESSYY